MYSKALIIGNIACDFAKSNNKYKQIMNGLPLLYWQRKLYCSHYCFSSQKWCNLWKWSVDVKHAYIHKVFIQCRNVYEELTPYESEYESVLMKGNIH